MTFSQVASQCVQYLVGVHGYSLGTADQYNRTYRQFQAHLSTMGLPDEPRSFTSESVLSFVTMLGNRKVSPNTIISKLGALSTLADHIMKLKDGRGRPMLKDGNPTKTFRWPEPIKVETKFLHPNELRAFLSVERPVSESIARDLLLDTAVRVTEACQANVESVVDIEGQVYLSCQVKGRKGHNAEPNLYPFSPRIGIAVKDYLFKRAVQDGRELRGNEPLLVNGTGQRWTRGGLTQLMFRIGQQAGITRFPVSAHKLKHTANVLARLAGVDRHTRSQLLAHGSDKVIERYEHLLPEELYQARARQDAQLQQYILPRS